MTTAALLGTAATVAALVATDIVPVPSWALNGVDVASHQHPGGSAIDWGQVAADGQKFAFIKATEGTSYTNPYFSGDSLKAQEAGVMPGSYHYARPGWNDPRAEARFYATTLATGAQPSLPPVLDLEEDGGLSPAQLQTWTREWVDEIQTLTGRKPIIYTYDWFWRNRMANTTEFSEYPLWLAYYSDSLPNNIPGGWSHVTFWQYSDKGSVNGIRGPVDMNSYYGDDAQLQALAKDLPSGTVAGDAATALEPIRDAASIEARIANEIEHATGVDVPMTTDFLMVLLGVIGGRLPVDALITQGAAQVEAMGGPEAIAQGVGGSSEDIGGDATTASPAGTPEGAPGSVATAQDVLKALTALTGALNEANANGTQLPLDLLTRILQEQGGGAVNVSQLLDLLQQFGGTQDWNAKLEAGEVPADPNAVEKLGEAAAAVEAAPAQ